MADVVLAVEEFVYQLGAFGRVLVIDVTGKFSVGGYPSGQVGIDTADKHVVVESLVVGEPLFVEASFHGGIDFFDRVGDFDGL